MAKKKIKGLKISLSEVSQTFNTEKLFKRKLSATAKKAFAERIIEEISIRTVSHRDINGKGFARYSKDYALNKGVARHAVDMVLENKMLQSQNSKTGKFKGGDLKIEIGKGKDTVKAYAHNTGFKGHPHIKKTPPREFFGIKEKEVEKIVSKIKKEFPDKEKINLLDFVKAANKTIGDRESAKQELISIFESL